MCLSTAVHTSGTIWIAAETHHTPCEASAAVGWCSLSVRQLHAASCSPAIRKLTLKFKSIQHCYAHPMRLPASVLLWLELTVCCLPLKHTGV